MTRVIAVDPGYDRCGVAVLEKKDGREVLVLSTCIETSSSLPFTERLRIIGDEFAAILKDTEPEVLALETLYFSKNQKTAMAVAEARGAITYLAAARGLSLQEYSPGSVKLAVTGSGNADKHQVIAMVPRLIVCDTDRRMLDDEYDAIAIGLTHLAHTRTTTR